MHGLQAKFLPKSQAGHTPDVQTGMHHFHWAQLRFSQDSAGIAFSVSWGINYFFQNASCTHGYDFWFPFTRILSAFHTCFIAFSVSNRALETFLTENQSRFLSSNIPMIWVLAEKRESVICTFAKKTNETKAFQLGKRQKGIFSRVFDISANTRSGCVRPLQ